MTEEEKLFLSAYKEIADISDHHNVKLVQNTCTGKIFVKKNLSVFNKSIYEWLINNPIINMPKIFFVAEDNNTLTVIEEYISGETLETIINEKGKISEKETAEIGIGLCKILSDLHSAKSPIIHRDIKPSNIILSSDGIVKLLDMNAARWFSENVNSDTQLIGTAGFAAPEQYGFGQSSQKTDIYEVGALMSILHYGVFPGEADFSGKIGSIIKKCTEIQPEKRYQTAFQLEHALHNLCQNNNNLQASIKNNNILRFLPPGFRTLNPGNMIAATILYFLAFGAVAWTNVKGTSAVGNAITRINLAITIVIIVILTYDWLDVQKKLPILKNSNPFIKLIGVLLYDVAVAIIMLIISIFVISIV